MLLRQDPFGAWAAASGRSIEAMSSTARPFSWKSVALAAFLPTLLFSIGEGAIIPLIPAVANNLGATLAVAGFISAMVMVGELAGDIPAGWVVSKIGERNAMIWGALLAVIGVLISIAAPSPLALGIGIFLVGLATAVFALARHAFMTTFVPMAYRARALSTLGGVFRAGWFVGPLIAAAIVSITGSSQSVFWLFAMCCLATVILLVLLPDPEAMFSHSARAAALASAGVRSTADLPGDGELSDGEKLASAETVGLFRTIWQNRAVLFRMGSGTALLSALRSSRAVLLPLWAVSIGISEPNTALIIGIAGGVDFALFYASGQVMDRFGRMWSAIPAMIGLGLGHAVLAFTHDLPDAVIWFIVVAMFLSLANGLSSGLVMTIGADLDPAGNPAPFLGAYRFTADSGSAAAPLAIAAITSFASLAVASALMGLLGFLGAGVLARYIPRYVPKRPHDS